MIVYKNELIFTYNKNGIIEETTKNEQKKGRLKHYIFKSEK